MDDDLYFLLHGGDHNPSVADAHWWNLMEPQQKWQHLEDCRAFGLRDEHIKLILQVYGEVAETVYV